MSTVGDEAGLENRKTASRITKRLVQKGILIPKMPVTKKQGIPTVYQFNYDLETCDPPVTGKPEKPVIPQSHPPVTLPATPEAVPVTLEGQTCDSPVTQRVEGLTQEKGKTKTGVRTHSKQKPNSRLSEKRIEMIANFGDEVFLALLFNEARLGILLSEEQINIVLERLTTLKACGENPVAAIPEVLRQVTAAHAANGHGGNGNHLGGNGSCGTPVAHLELGSQGFAAFCGAYPPARLDRKYALRTWCKDDGCEKHVAEILVGLESWKGSAKWKERNGQFIPYASNFLERERWRNAPHMKAESAREFPRFEVESWAK